MSDVHYFNDSNDKVDNDVQLLNLMDSYYKNIFTGYINANLVLLHRVSYDSFPELQRKGVDVILIYDNGAKFLLEEKFRYEQFDDIALEKWSSVENKKIGWTLDDNKISDYIIYVNEFIHVFDYKKLRTLYKENVDRWDSYPILKTPNKQKSGHVTHTIGVGVPLSLIESTLVYTDSVRYRNIKLENEKKIKEELFKKFKALKCKL